jgi:hypothetical protein
MSVGVGGQGFVGIAVETTPGTYVAPTTYVPILSESFQYTEDRYISPAIRKSTIANDVKQNFYHAEGDIDMEVDTSTIIYFLHACRLSVVKTGAGPYNYVYTPSGGASVGPNGNNATVKTLSVTIVRNLQVFKYVGCVASTFAFRIEDGILKATFTMMGLGETSVNTDTPPTPTFTTPSLLGAAAHTVSIAPVVSSPTVPTWVVSTNFQTYTFTVNDNGAAQNRINSSRQAAFISYGETEATISATRDFEVRADYDNFVATSLQAFQLKSVNSAGDSIQFNTYRGAYTAFPISLPGIGELVVAAAEIRQVNNGARLAYDITVNSGTSIT